MSTTYSVAIQYKKDLGYIEYDAEKKAATVVLDPTADVESFKTALTRLWEATDVHVDWSRPVDYVKEHRKY